ncbi:polysaccharide pyruvyl transferase family protein [bacterium]|nr:polysaccharide pyruvyl transferase family protein [bacterium]
MSGPVVLINSVYSFRNRGDSAIVEAMSRCLQRLVPGVEIHLLSTFWEENDPYYGPWRLQSAPYLWDIPMDDNKVRRLARAIVALGRLAADPRRSASLPPRGAARTRALYRRASLVIDCGGGSLFSSNRYWFYLGLYQHLFNLWAAGHRRIPVVIAPQSIGPFNKWADEQATRALLRRLHCVMVREPESARLLERWRVPCHLVPDAAFLGDFLPASSPALDPLVAGAQDRARTGVNLGLTVLDWHWADETAVHRREAIDEYLVKLVAVCDRVHARHPLHVHIIPQVTVAFGDSDRGASEQLAAGLRGRVASVTVIDADLPAAQLQAFYGQMQVFVGSRMHSTILAMLAGVPAIGLAYQPKTFGTYELLGLREFVFDIRAFTVDAVAACLLGMIDNRTALRARVQTAVNRARGQVEQAFRDHVVPLLQPTELSAP